MSRATKRKHVVRELLEERVLPAPRQRIVRVLGTPGNNLHEVETAEGTRFLASMPPRFRRHIWIKRGDFLLVDPIEEGTKARGLHTPGEVEPPGGPPPCRGRGPLR
ncbi:probable RNA-binding protein EIF1AD isoform X3 [Aquila chrysaetos chrysaetos]|uniref:probable RNA-binding protein EIF1AD isoform X3 n=1 Tax=Aquila chrysaetos chrysaetos TaxID=223781 RepID=UPI00117677C3|nr:probable RNA-binding protein EIF1AD isoform X3 [Aquila chrysaetos chrysaetos]